MCVCVSAVGRGGERRREQTDTHCRGEGSGQVCEIEEEGRRRERGIQRQTHLRHRGFPAPSLVLERRLAARTQTEGQKVRGQHTGMSHDSSHGSAV